jgi:hypothetical protein
MLGTNAASALQLVQPTPKLTAVKLIIRESRLLTTYEIATRRRSATVKQERQSFSNPVPRHEQSPFSNSSDGPASCGSTAVDRRTPLHTVETFERESTSASSLTVCLAEVGSPQILYLPTSTMSKMRARRHYTHTNSTSSALTSAFSLLYVLAQHAVLSSLHVGIIRMPSPTHHVIFCIPSHAHFLVSVSHAACARCSCISSSPKALAPKTLIYPRQLAAATKVPIDEPHVEAPTLYPENARH